MKTCFPENFHLSVTLRKHEVVQLLSLSVQLFHCCSKHYSLNGVIFTRYNLLWFPLFVACVCTPGVCLAKSHISRQTTVYFRRTDMQLISTNDQQHLPVET